MAEACSQRSLQLLSGMFEKTSVQSGDLPEVGKSHDDLFLRPPNTSIGERPCLNGDACLARFIAQVRHGVDTDLAFTCTEFLLPEAHRAFLDGKGLPARRGKCLLCCRYFQTYTYILMRTDPSFKIGQSNIGLQPQIFCNPVADTNPINEENLRSEAALLPTHASRVSASDGYLPSAMLYVDEDFANMRAARETNMGKLLFRPVVRFCSTHYSYIRDNDGPRIV